MGSDHIFLQGFAKSGEKRVMEDKKSKYKLIIILAACAVAAATGAGLRWNDRDAIFMGKHHGTGSLAESGAGSADDGAINSIRENGEGGTDSSSEEEQKEWEKEFFARYQGDFEKECELSDGRIRYRMVIMDAAAGSRWYGLLKSEDRGLSWQMVSDSPFGGDMGMGIEFTFLDEELGFATLTHNGGDEADLYITENGGENYQPVELEEITVTLDDGFRYNPYDFPQMPYEEDGKLYVLCGQGADGDYDGGDAAGMALFESADGGHTFSYKEIRKGEEK